MNELAPFAAAPKKAQGPALDEVERAIGAAKRALLDKQRPDGHFVFELEADVSIPAEYILYRHFLGDLPPPALEEKIGRYLRRQQSAIHDGWPLLHGDKFNLSSSVKAYFALKVIGDSVDAPHMQRARASILAHGGAAQANVFTRALLATYGIVPWRAVPVMPIEIMLLPEWFPFHLSKVSYWARTVLVPLMVVMNLKGRACNPRGVGLDELFIVPPQEVRRWAAAPQKSFPWTGIFAGIDHVLRFAEPYFPERLRKSALAKAAAFVTERLNGEDGLGAIFPAMINSIFMYHLLGYPEDHPNVVVARRSVENLLVIKDDEAYCQPCVSPVWDTALMSHALMEAGGTDIETPVARALAWLRPLQVLDVAGDWAVKRPDAPPGGWAFQYANAHYPDLDDTAVVVLAMDRAGKSLASIPSSEYAASIERAQQWVEAMQSRNGGFGAFDADNDHTYLNYIPFADHGALLDPPTEDVTARCISMLAQLGETPQTNPHLARAVDYLLAEQQKDGSWYGRWGINYIYGTWSALCALNAVGSDHKSTAIRNAVGWLKAIQNDDGGWGEDGNSYALDYKGYEKAPSTASQTAWALLGLMAAGEVADPAVAKGMSYLLGTQGGDGSWHEESFTGTGFPRVFYLRYHGYSKFFPLWALARFRNLTRSNHPELHVGM
ncbi:squalene--hopene cyclase [Methylovirgula sp. HY1]|uniref:squalene--hopene cyclase n=1 Tax=Methylovirgula sp. HY1 TaxID=2822761 RepID=UPI001C5BC0C9|nr:squalene--hopene cyclase [Methylovirgula sp. HY1]QXX75105.1 Squalene--hopene cyclase [Methylovirgula sp. HY1]